MNSKMKQETQKSINFNFLGVYNMKLVYSNKTKKCLGIYNGTENSFVKYIDDNDKQLEGNLKNVTIIAEQEQLDEFMRR